MRVLKLLHQACARHETDCMWLLLGYMAGQMVYQQDVSQSAGFVGQSAVSTGYSQMPARQHDPQVCVHSVVSNIQLFFLHKSKADDRRSTFLV